MTLDESISAIESSATTGELLRVLKTISENYGFATFNFLDTGALHLDVPFHMGTLQQDFVDQYLDAKLVGMDPCVSVARKTNLPFIWSDVQFRTYKGIRKSGAQKTMEFALDHGYQNGLVVPFHFADKLGRLNSSLIVFFWSSTKKKLQFLLKRKKHEMHLIMVYWAQRAVDLIGEKQRGGARFQSRDEGSKRKYGLTDRERDVLSWAARGKTAHDTSDILFLSEDTVKTHIRNALHKLEANNKTHGVTKAIYLGLIDV